MWESKTFTKDQMVAWENKIAAQQIWQNLQDYFTEKWLEHIQYSQTTLKHSCCKDAALTAQELAAAEEEGEATEMMFTLLQEQDKAQLEAMAASNMQAIDIIFEFMNALVAGHGKAADKVTSPPANSNTVCASSGLKHNKKKCTIFRKHVFHKPEDCYKLKDNPSKRWPG